MSMCMDTRMAAQAMPAPQQQHSEGGTRALLGVADQLDLMNSEPFLDRARSLARSSRCVIVDLTRASFVDSNGVRALLQLAEELEADDKQLRLVVTPGSRAGRTLGLLRLIGRLAAFPTLEDAFAGISALTS